MVWEPVIGLEVHAELLTQSKMFCGCAVVDSITAEPNRYICPVGSGMPSRIFSISSGSFASMTDAKAVIKRAP